MNEAPSEAYGEGRTRAGVSYAEVERAAIAILKSERRPTVDTVRKALGTGSPDTIGSALKRFWRNLGARIDGDPAALTRMPPDIADLADGMWQRALKLANEAAKHDDNAARERLRQIEVENEIRAHSLTLREKEWDAAARGRERALADAREHILILAKALGQDRASLRAREERIADLAAQISQHREQIAGLITGTIARHRSSPRPAESTPITARSGRRRLLVEVSRRAKQPHPLKKAPKKSKRASDRRSRSRISAPKKRE